MSEITDDQIPTIIQAAINHHKSIKAKVDFTKNDKLHAHYIVLGGIITITCTAYSLNQQGNKMSLLPLRRLMQEAVELVIFIEELPNESRQLKAWFRGEIIERNEKKSDVKDRIEAEVYSIEQIAEKDKFTKKYNDLLSKYTHPSITLLRANMSKSTFDYDYFNAYTKPVLLPRDFVNSFLIPCMHAILLPIKTIKISVERYEILKTLALSLENIEHRENSNR